MRVERIIKQEEIVAHLQQAMLSQLEYVKDQGLEQAVSCESLKELATAINMAAQALEIMQRERI